ncbi:aldehyde dehydrogenase family protein [Intrasporangium chromatireducens]|uniref:aldehyde dehydrogenase family protein n=1 Tax=Intrasporangium chromatireducens TaxID=1386088 RepID=UPI0006850CAB|nr:aldehyde dehydrogenase family protein [Intrasporangium chromatireducens]
MDPSSSAAVERAIAAAHGARREWARLSAGERASNLKRAADVAREQARDLGALLCATTGRLAREAVSSATAAADLLDEAAVAGTLGAGRSLAGSPGSFDWVRVEPRGVVAVLTPWNDPYPAAAGLIAAALMTGNTVVHKPSERSSEPGLMLGRIIASCLPAGVLELVDGDGTVGAAIVADPRVDVVAHVGSTATGRAISRATAARGAKSIVENGGKDPIVVDADVDPAWAAEQIGIGCFTNGGQLCTAVERVYLHEAVADSVIAHLVRHAEALRPGDPGDDATTLTPIVDERQLAVIDEHVRSAVAAGARCLTGGARLDRPGPWYAPTVLTDCTADMQVMREETFGPVAPITVVPSFGAGLDLACESDYGLAATVLTRDQRHATEAIERLDVGTVKVNAVFGGAPGGSADPRRGSGHGRGYGPDLFGEFVALKAVHLEPAP